MIDTITRPEHRLMNVRVPADLYSRVQRIADDRYEGKVSMAAREAFRRFVSDETNQVVEEEITS